VTKWATRIVGILRLFLGIEVIEVAEELVEPVNCRQVLIAGSSEKLKST